MYYWYRLLDALTPKRVISAVLAVLTLTVGTIYSRPLGERILTGSAYAIVSVHHTPTLVVPPLPGVTRLVDSKGNLLATFAAQAQVPTTLSQTSRSLVNALLSSEDRTFFTNDGIDSRGIMRAALDDLLHHASQGGSTITQQYVKNLLISEYGVAYADASSIARKVREVAYASELTRLLSKDQILEGYLNTVYFGEGAYGIGAAAERYFSVPASQLNDTQSALLVALLRSPTGYDPVTHPSLALQERNVVLGTMLSNHVLSYSTEIVDAASPLGLKLSTLTQGCLTSVNPYFCDWVSGTLLSLPELGATRSQRLARLDAGGLTITTTLNPQDQTAAQTAVTSKVPFSSPIGSAMVMVRPGTGAVLAMANNRVYGLNVKHNQTTLNYTLSRAPVGSTMKLFTLATALTEGVPLSTILPAGAQYHSNVFMNPPGGYFSNAEPYDPTYINLATATAFSVNTAFVQLEEKVGVLAVARMARSMGLNIPSSGTLAPTAKEGSFTLGARAFTPLEMASAYASVAAGGLYCAPQGVLSITYPDHRVAPVASTCQQVMAPAVATAITGLLANVVKYGTGTAAAVPGHPLVGKTGTTSNFGAAWFDGFTPQLACAVMMTNPLGPTHPLYNIDGVSQVYGGTLPAEEFSLAMTAALVHDPVWSIPAPTDAYLVVPHLNVPDLYGLSAATARTRLEAIGLKYRGPSVGVVTGYSPAPGTPVTAGQIVTVKTGAW